MLNFSFYELFFYFIIYAFLGWSLEVLFHIYTMKKFINRGFLYGPICPIYGISAVVMIVTLTPFKNNIVYLFIGGFVVSSALEFITGYLMEKFFDTRWWDYSEDKYNLMGYISLKFSIAWGALSVLFIREIQPLAEKMVERLPRDPGIIIMYVLMILVLLDVVFTVNKLVVFSKWFRELQRISKELKENLENLKDHTLDRARKLKLEASNVSLMENYEKLSGNIKRRYRYLIKAYPRVTSSRFGELLEEVKEKISETLSR